MIRQPLRSPLFPYTTLFRSELAVKEGRFRQDLFHRLGQFQLRVPPLRERPEDIVALAEYFLSLKAPSKNFSEQAISRSEEHTSELQSRRDLVCRLLLEKKKD